MKAVTKEAYAVVRLYIAAGADAWKYWEANGGGTWPESDPSARQLEDTIFEYVPTMSIAYNGEHGPDNCPTEEERRPDKPCFALYYDVVFSPQNVQNMIQALDARTDPAIVAEFQAAGPPADGAGLEWWAVALTAGALIAIGGLPFAGALIVKIAGYLLAAWAAYGFITPSTPQGKSIAEQWLDKLKEGFDSIFKKAMDLGKMILAGFGLYLGYKVLVD